MEASLRDQPRPEGVAGLSGGRGDRGSSARMEAPFAHQSRLECVARLNCARDAGRGGGIGRGPLRRCVQRKRGRVRLPSRHPVRDRCRRRERQRRSQSGIEERWIGNLRLRTITRRRIGRRLRPLPRRGLRLRLSAWRRVQARPRTPGGHGIAKARHALNAANAPRAAHDRAWAPERRRSLRCPLSCGRAFGALERRLGQPDRLGRPAGLLAFGRPVALRLDRSGGRRGP